MINTIIIVYLIGSFVGMGISKGTFISAKNPPTGLKSFKILLGSFIGSWYTVGIWIGGILGHLDDDSQSST